MGLFPNTGALIVFDPELQVSGQTTINAYSANRDLVRAFDASKIRGLLQTVHGEVRDKTLHKYALWKRKHIKEFLQQELRLIEEKILKAEIEVEQERIRKEIEIREKRELAVKRHREFVLAAGFEYAGTTTPRPRFRRVTHCWNCSMQLDNSTDIECITCGWIICTCGACGCGRSNGSDA